MSTISKLNVDAIIDKSITSDKLADDFMLLSDALENEEVTAAALTDLNTKKADKTEIDEITQTLASKADAEVVSALQQDLDDKADASELNNYLPLSGGIMTGSISGLTSLTSAGNVTATEYGFRLSSTQYDGYIWNTVAGKGISIGLIDNGSTSIQSASLNIKGPNIYPGTSNKFSLGTDSLKFKDIFADGVIKGSRFLYGTKTKAELESINNSGLSIAIQIPLNESTAGDYGFHAVNNGNGVLALRTHVGSGENYMHYLGFSNDGEIYHRHSTSGNAVWRNITNPIGSIKMPRDIDTLNYNAVIPSMLNEGIINIFNYPLKSELLIERSQDGSTWIDVTEDEYEKFRKIFTKGYNRVSIGNIAYNASGNGAVGDRLRITYMPNSRYCSMGYIDVYYSSNGATTTFTFELNNKNDEGTWVKVHDAKSLTGWPGHNYYGLSGYKFGQTNGSNYYACRMTFEITAVNTTYNSRAAVSYIYGFTSETPYSSVSDSYFNYDISLHAYRNTAHIIPSSTGYELGNQQFPFKNIITQSLGISFGSGHTPSYISSDTNSNMFIKIADVIPFVVDCTDASNPVIRPSVSMGSKVDLGKTGQPWRNVYASKFITTGGTASQVVLGDGTLKNLSEISSNVDSITTNNIILNGTSYTKLASGLIYSTLPRDTNTVPAGYYFWNQDTSQVISNYSGFNENTPDTIIIGEKITFNGDNIIKMDGLDDLNGGTIIYCLSYTPKGNIAINGAVYN